MAKEVDLVPRPYFTEDALKGIGALNPFDKLGEQRLIFDSGMRSDAYIYGYQIQSRNPQGHPKTSYLAERNMLSFAFGLEEKARKQWNRYLEFQKLGVPVPKPYCLRKATIYQEFIANEQMQTAVDSIKRTDPSQTNPLLDQLIGMAVILDASRFRPSGILRDLIFDGDRKQFLYVDVGWDLSEVPPDPAYRGGQKELCEKFKTHAQYIRYRYEELRTQSLRLQTSLR